MFQQVTIAELYWFAMFLKGYPLEAKATPLYWLESNFGIIIQDRFSLGGAVETLVQTSIDALVNMDKAWENLSLWVCK